jgi:hypothetical protein
MKDRLTENSQSSYEDIPKNLYSLLFNNSSDKSKLEKLILDETKSDEQLINSTNENDNYFILDNKAKEERNRRLNEKDKTYKIKKHYFLKDSYKKIIESEYAEMFFKSLVEKDYLRKCEIAENKLLIGNELNVYDVNNLIKRNYSLFSKMDQQKIDYVQDSFKIYYMSCVPMSILFISFIRAFMVFFKLEIKSRFISYAFLSIYCVGIYFSLNMFINRNYIKQLLPRIENTKDQILNPNNANYKTPIDENPKTWNAEKYNPINSFKL